MTEIEQIKKLISSKKENAFVDFKRDFYSSLKRSDFPKDVAAFANAVSSEDRYLVFGVVDDTREVVGIDPQTFPTQDTLDDYIHHIFSPFVDIDTGIVEVDGKHIAYIKVLSSNQNPPYVIEKACGENNKINQGDIYIRKGSCNQKASREDLDNMYLHSGKILIQIAKSNLIMVEPIHLKGHIPPNPTYGHLDVEIYNTSSNPSLISDGFIEIKNKDNYARRNIHFCSSLCPLSEHPFEIPPKSRKIYSLLFDFTSQDCVDFRFYTEGFIKNIATIQISLQDIDGRTHLSNCHNASIKAEGNILHKVLRLHSSKKSLTRKFRG